MKKTGLLRLPVMLVLLAGCSAGSFAQEEEAATGLDAEDSAKLKALEADYQLEHFHLREQHWDEPMRKLRGGYRNRLNQLQTRFTQAGELSKAVLARDAAKKDPTRDSISEQSPVIASAQKVFLDAQQNLQERHDRARLKLGQAHVLKLKAIKDHFARATNLDAALYLEKLIGEVVADLDKIPTPKRNPREAARFAKGLVAYYPFNGNAKDESGNRNDGEVKGATLTTDRHGKQSSAYSFDGKDDFIEVTSSPELRALPSLSVSVWIQVDPSQSGGPNGYNQILSSWGGGGDGRAWSIGTGGRGSHLAVDCGPNDPHRDLFNAPRTPIENGVWLHVIYTHGPNGAALYLNGKAIVDTRVSFDLNPFIEPLIFGADNKGGRANFRGLIDEVRIYNRALSAKEVSAIYDSEKPRG